MPILSWYLVIKENTLILLCKQQEIASNLRYSQTLPQTIVTAESLVTPKERFNVPHENTKEAKTTLYI